MDPVIARRTWRTLEPVHGLIYFTPHADREYTAAGLEGNRMGYFATRSAPMGPVPAEVVIATFFNFHPGLVRRAIPRAWELAAPAAIIDARYAAADAAVRDALGDRIGSADVRDAATLARAAAEAAARRPEGRPLFAAHAALPWPDEPHLVLWHAQTLLREFRGDAHVAALVAEGLDGVEALVSHAASGDVAAETLRTTRAWPDGDWSAAFERLRMRGLVAGEPATPTFTEAGRAQRERIEAMTDAAAVPAYEALGEDGCARLREILRPISRAIVDRGLLAPR